MWTCQRCTVENASTATHCVMCYLDRNAKTNPTEWWQCSNCGVFNFAELGKCVQCNRPPGGFSLGATADGNGRDPDLAKIPKDSGLETSDECRERDTSRLQEEAARQFVAAPLLSTAAPATGLSETAVSSAAETEEAAAIATLQQMHLYDQSHLLQDGEILDFPDRECRVVLVGKTGNGKSATANTILGLDKRFATSFQFGSLTRKCQRHSGFRFGIPMEVVDTPGLFDTGLDKATVTTEITKCLSIIAPGPHAILLVLRIGVRFTREEAQAVEEVHKLFGPQLLRFLVIVFTHGDELNDCSESEKERVIKGMLDDAPDELKDLLSQANHRYVIFDNTASEASKKQQVRELLITIRNLLRVNGGGHYTSNLLRQVELCMQKREQELQREHGGRRRARGNGSQRPFYRDIAREEVVQEEPLLDRIKKVVVPILEVVLPILLKVLVGLLVRGGVCSLM